MYILLIFEIAECLPILFLKAYEVVVKAYYRISIEKFIEHSTVKTTTSILKPFL
jgi:hypothetical protein